MRVTLFLFLTLWTGIIKAQSYQDIHNKAILIDTHNDFLTKAMEYSISLDMDLRGKAQSDLTRFKIGGLDVQFFSVWSDGKQLNAFAFANRQIDSLDAVIGRNPDKIVKVGSVKEILQVIKLNKIAALIGLEGGHQIENSIQNLDSLYKRGTRYITLTWNNSTDWATSAFDDKRKSEFKGKGLSAFGKMVIRHMNEI
ncbi:MAG: hypothetical protein EOO46_24655 [Flavobacterium sp.]|nr:MAG: hypothetical protein EOO46_24655 [Flavobacterium sp.]